MTTDTAHPLRGPQRLYEDWERAHWAAQDVDLSRDRADWERMDDDQRRLLHSAGALGGFGLSTLTRRLKLIGVSL